MYKKKNTRKESNIPALKRKSILVNANIFIKFDCILMNLNEIWKDYLIMNSVSGSCRRYTETCKIVLSAWCWQ